jgi:hypothetical protein
MVLRRTLTVWAAILFALPGTPALAQGKFAVGQKVKFEDIGGNYGGGMVPGTIVADHGPGNYLVHVDVPANPAFQTIELYERRLTADGPSPAAARAPEPGPPLPQPREAANPAPARARAPAPALRPNQGPTRLDNRPSRGQVMPVLDNRTQFLGRNAPVPPGRKAFYVYSNPGDELPFGRWDLRVGGQFTNVGGPVNGRQTQEYGLPERAEAIAIKPDGTWEKNDLGRRSSGRWVDIGQNVVRLLDYGGPNEDYTASTWHGQIDVVSALGEHYRGRRF